MTCVIAVDPGLRNLALCCRYDNTTLFWQNLTVLGDPETCINCNRPAKWKNPFACGIHRKKLGCDVIYTPKKVSDYSTYQIVRKIIDTLDVHAEYLIDMCDPDDIVLELQPGKNPRMKLVSHVAFAFFVDRFPLARVRFVRASGKLRSVAKADKKTYAMRKKKSVELVTSALEDKDDIAFFNLQKKSDDLADVWLMAEAAM